MFSFKKGIQLCVTDYILKIKPFIMRIVTPLDYASVKPDSPVREKRI